MGEINQPGVSGTEQEKNKEKEKMKKIIAGLMVALAAAVSAQAADVSASVDFASAYVFRGTTFNNGLVAQPGVEVSGFPIPEEYGSLAFGIWGNYDIDDEDNDGSDFQEIDYYMSYTLPIEELDVSFGYTEYDYPDSAAPGQNDQEVSLSIGSAVGEDGLYAGISFYYGVGGGIDGNTYIEGALDYETELSEALSAAAGVTVGYLSDANGGGDGFNDATASVGLSYALDENWSVGAGLTYIAQLDQAVLTDAEYDVELLGTVGLACDF